MTTVIPTIRKYFIFWRKTEDAGWKRGWLYVRKSYGGYGGKFQTNFKYYFNNPNKVEEVK